jgi:hypothetical protein
MAKVILLTTIMNALTAQVAGQNNGDIFEAPEFNITQALIDNGVDASSLPKLGGVDEQALDSSPCSITVSSLFYTGLC